MSDEGYISVEYYLQVFGIVLGYCSERAIVYSIHAVETH